MIMVIYYFFKSKIQLKFSVVVESDQPSTSRQSLKKSVLEEVVPENIQPSTSRESILEYVEDSDDSHKDPNYCPSSGSGDDDQENVNVKNYNLLVPAHETEQEEIRDKENEEVQDIQKEVEQKKKSRKRTKHIETWRSTKRHNATLRGEEHMTKKGKNIAAKAVKSGCAPCRRNCTEKIPDKLRKQIFKEYWSEEKNWDVKRQFVCSHIESKPTERRRPKDNSKNSKKQTINYFFDIPFEGLTKKVDVCKTYFVNTLGISETVVRNALKKQTAGGFVSRDMRGRHVPPNKLPEEVLNGVRAHIKSFPSYESHYSREKSKRHYLGPELSIEKMYRLYLAKCEEDRIPKQQTSKLWVYKKCFNTEFNLSFKKPSADTCDICDSFTLKLKDSQNNEKAVFQQEYENHLKEADKRYKMKRNDKEQSKDSKDITKVIMLDLQKCLPTPYLSNNQSFYYLKLWTFNLTIYDSTNNSSYCLLWDESEAGRGGNEIASALIKWTRSTIADSSIEHLIIWSDNCPSQNRNIIMMLCYLWLLKICPNLKTVEHKFLLRGHTHMEADHVHALIERTLKKQPTMEICTPWDWQQLIRSTGATVIKLDIPDFKHVDHLYSQPNAPFINKKKNTEKEDFLISNVVHFQVKAARPNTIFYKLNFDDEFKTLNVTRSIRNPAPMPDELTSLRCNLKGITKKKREYLIKSLEWVPQQFHNFYKNIPICKTKGQDSSDEEDSE